LKQKLYKPNLNTFNWLPWVSETRRARNPWRQVGSYCGEGAQGDRREGDGGLASIPRRLQRDGHSSEGSSSQYFNSPRDWYY